MRPLKPNEDPLSGTQIYVIVVAVGTVTAWCLNSFLSVYTGEMGILAIVPLVAFFGFGVLRCGARALPCPALSCAALLAPRLEPRLCHQPAVPRPPRPLIHFRSCCVLRVLHILRPVLS